jgi:hypothetical protein
VYLAKKSYVVYNSSSIVQVNSYFNKKKLLDILTPQVNLQYKKSPLMCLLAVNILNKLYQHENEWPKEFLETYIGDFLNERLWCDNELAQDFVRKIKTGFQLYENNQGMYFLLIKKKKNVIFRR